MYHWPDKMKLEFLLVEPIKSNLKISANYALFSRKHGWSEFSASSHFLCCYAGPLWTNFTLFPRKIREFHRTQTTNVVMRLFSFYDHGIIILLRKRLNEIESKIRFEKPAKQTQKLLRTSTNRESVKRLISCAYHRAPIIICRKQHITIWYSTPNILTPI